MTQLKYRARTSAGALLPFTFDEIHSQDISGEGFYLNQTSQVMQSGSVERWTGLTDKNNIDIYEGDILDTLIGRLQVIYQFASFSLGDGVSVFEFGFMQDEIDPKLTQVIGNMVDNRELMQ